MNPLSLLERIVRDTTPLTKRFVSLDFHAQLGMDWLCRAQDSQRDGGVSLRYSLVKGWDASYPETTGYIIPTFLGYAVQTGNDAYAQRAIRMADWELAIQEEDGSFKGGAVGSGYGSFVFDTGQVLFGLIDAHRATHQQRYLDAAIQAGRWLVETQDDEGMWKRHTYNAIPHVYYSRVAWALAELGAYVNEPAFSTAAGRNIDWVLTKQSPNGWFDDAGFTKETHRSPFTHTIAYTIEGVLETGIRLKRDDYIHAANTAAASLIQICREGLFKGTYDRHWGSDVAYSCLTGNGQIALILLRLHELSNNERYLHTAQSINRRLCHFQDTDGPSTTRGAISGSYPIWGGYQRFAFPNWATKFFVDALLLEKRLVHARNHRAVD